MFWGPYTSNWNKLKGFPMVLFSDGGYVFLLKLIVSNQDIGLNIGHFVNFRKVLTWNEFLAGP